MTPMAPWLQAHLIEQGALTHDRLTTRPTPRACSRCGAAVLAAIESEGPGLPRCRVEATPRRLTPLGELQAVVADVPTYRLHTDPASKPTALSWRTPSHISGRPADKCVVVAAHRCRAIHDSADLPQQRSFTETDPFIIPF